MTIMKVQNQKNGADCMNNQTEYNFKVGDEVITSIGEVGVITDICDCEYCQERGFCEPQVETTLGVWDIYITNRDKENNFSRFYKIGDYRFGNIDKSILTNTLQSWNDRLEETKKNVEIYNQQLIKLMELE